jgi:hypothetical protein
MEQAAMASTSELRHSVIHTPPPHPATYFPPFTSERMQVEIKEAWLKATSSQPPKDVEIGDNKDEKKKMRVEREGILLGNLSSSRLHFLEKEGVVRWEGKVQYAQWVMDRTSEELEDSQMKGERCEGLRQCESCRILGGKLAVVEGKSKDQRELEVESMGVARSFVRTLYEYQGQISRIEKDNARLTRSGDRTVFKLQRQLEEERRTRWTCDHKLWLYHRSKMEELEVEKGELEEGKMQLLLKMEKLEEEKADLQDDKSQLLLKSSLLQRNLNIAKLGRSIELKKQKVKKEERKGYKETNAELVKENAALKAAQQKLQDKTTALRKRELEVITVMIKENAALKARQKMLEEENTKLKGRELEVLASHQLNKNVGVKRALEEVVDKDVDVNIDVLAPTTIWSEWWRDVKDLLWRCTGLLGRVLFGVLVGVFSVALCVHLHH